MPDDDFTTDDLILGDGASVHSSELDSDNHGAEGTMDSIVNLNSSYPESLPSTSSSVEISDFRIAPNFTAFESIRENDHQNMDAQTNFATLKQDDTAGKDGAVRGAEVVASDSFVTPKYMEEFDVASYSSGEDELHDDVLSFKQTNVAFSDESAYKNEEDCFSVSDHSLTSTEKQETASERSPHSNNTTERLEAWVDSSAGVSEYAGENLSLDNVATGAAEPSYQYPFNENLVWVISEFLPQEDVCNSMIYVSKMWNYSLHKFPLILDQRAVKSLLGKRAIRLAYHLDPVTKILKNWSIGYLCVRLKSRDLLSELFNNFPEMADSLWGMVVKTKKKTRWAPVTYSEGHRVIARDDENEECEAIRRCKTLEVLDIRCCGGLQDLSYILRNCTNTLRRLDLSGCNELTNASILALCHSLESLCLDNCENLVEIPDLIWCPNLRSFLLGQCERLEALPDLSRCPMLSRIHLGNCSSLHDVSTLYQCLQLREISIARYEALTDLSCFADFRMLVTLDLAYCKNLRRVTGLSECINLKYVSFDYCAKLRDISALKFCPRLHTISLTYCKQIRDISGLVGCWSPTCGRLHTVDANELEYFARLERAQGIRPINTGTTFTGWRQWVQAGCFANSINSDIANGVLFTIPGMGKYIPPIKDRVKLKVSEAF